MIESRISAESEPRLHAFQKVRSLLDPGLKVIVIRVNFDAGLKVDWAFA